ncbi:hypothetical protein [Endozoicomonas sp. Mp262]|uniref:hypothetical protein n=1 Tax=Endozoicomonas sp. Mp262 TaxID=2919499 RepID=UPI0021D83A15
MNTYDALNAFQKKPPSNESKTLYSHQRWVSGIFPAIILSVVTNAFCATHSTNGSSSEDIQYTEVTNPANRKPSRLGSIFQRLCSWIGKSDKQEDSISSDSEEESEHIEKPRHRNLSGKSDISTVAELEKAQMKGYLSKDLNP